MPLRAPLSIAAALAAMAALAGCGGSTHRRTGRHAAPDHRAPLVGATATPTGLRRAGGSATRTRRRVPAPEALVAAETVDGVFALNLRDGAVSRHLAVPGGPQYVDGDADLAVASSRGPGR